MVSLLRFCLFLPSFCFSYLADSFSPRCRHCWERKDWAKGMTVTATVLTSDRVECCSGGVFDRDVARKDAIGTRRRMRGDGDENGEVGKLPFFVIVVAIYLTSTFLFGHHRTRRWCQRLLSLRGKE